VLLAVRIEAVATPLLSVAAVVVTVPLANVPLAPLDGAVNVTVAFGTKFPEPSFTVACSAAVNAVPIIVLCGVPPVADMLAGPVPPFNAASNSTILRLYLSLVGAVSLIVTLVPLRGIELVCLCTQ
jgi:hypothetical protein